MDTNTKNFLKSRTIWSILLGLVVFLINKYGLTRWGIKAEDAPAILGFILDYGTEAFMALAVYFRVVAEKKVSVLPPPSEDGGSNIPGIGVILLCLLSLPMCACGPTPFQTGLATGGPVIAAVETKYVNADTALSDKAPRLADAEALRAATAKDPLLITVDDVGPAWEKVKPAFDKYVADDTVISPTHKKVRQDMSKKMDELILGERQRTGK